MKNSFFLLPFPELNLLFKRVGDWERSIEALKGNHRDGARQLALVYSAPHFIWRRNWSWLNHNISVFSNPIHSLRSLHSVLVCILKHIEENTWRQTMIFVVYIKSTCTMSVSIAHVVHSTCIKSIHKTFRIFKIAILFLCKWPWTAHTTHCVL